MADRYSAEQVAAQTAAVATMRRDERKSFRDIAEALGLSLATVHRRFESVADLSDRTDAERGAGLRAEATMEVRVWLGRLEESYLAAIVRERDGALPTSNSMTLAQAFPLVIKGWEFLARLNGANLPMRIKVQDERPGRRADPDLLAALEREARAAEQSDALESREILA